MQRQLFTKPTATQRTVESLIITKRKTPHDLIIENTQNQLDLCFFLYRCEFTEIFTKLNLIQIRQNVSKTVFMVQEDKKRIPIKTRMPFAGL